MSFSTKSRRRAFRKITSGLVSIGLLSSGFIAVSDVTKAQAAPPAPLPYFDTSLPFSVRAADLVSRMTYTEKQQQLRAQTQTNSTTNATSGAAPAIPRLGVPAYAWWNEALHGVARSGGSVNPNPAGAGLATDFPTGIGLASSWDTEMVLAAETVVSDEARAFTNYYNTNVGAHNKGLTYWSPTINMHRDPRWGRAEETYGEDPYLTGEIGAQFTLGLQGGNDSHADDTATDGTHYLKAIATPKHFLANNAENVRHTGTAVVTETELREYYTPAFARLVGEGVGAKSLMTAYNHVTVTGQTEALPMSANFPILSDMVKRQWGFEGVITSDCDAIRDSWDPRQGGLFWIPDDVKALGNSYTGTNNADPSQVDLSGDTWDQPSGIAYTLKAGTDLDCMDNDYTSNVNVAGLTSTATRPTGAVGLEVSAANGYVSEADLDISLVRAFTIRMQTGEFDNGGRDNAQPATGNYSELFGKTPWGKLVMAAASTNPSGSVVAVDTPAHRALAKEAAAAGTVILKNDPGTLPLSYPTASKKYVVVGQMAQMAVHGDYSPQTSYEYNLSAQQAIKEFIAAELGKSAAQVVADGNYTYIPGIDMTGKWGYKKFTFGRTNVTGTDATTGDAIPSGRTSALRFLDADGAELKRITPQEIYKSGLIDGWRGSQPWGPYSATSTMTDSGSWNGYFQIDTEIPAGTAEIVLDRTNAGSVNTEGTLVPATTPGDPDQRCYAYAQWTGSFEVLKGERYTGTPIGQIPLTKCIDDPFPAIEEKIAANPELNTTALRNAERNRLKAEVLNAPRVEITAPGGVAALAGTKTKLTFEFTSDWGFDGFTPEEEAIIEAADVVIGYAGTTALQSLCATNPDDPGAGCSGGTSASSDSSEDEDRSSLDLPRLQDQVILKAAQLAHTANPSAKVIAWMSTVSQMNVEPFKNDVDAIVWTSYNGQSQSRNIPDVLFGDVNPSGHLTFSWYTDQKQLPPTGDYQMIPDAAAPTIGGHNGRTYQYFTGDVTYPFGHGLNYSNFTYANLAFDKGSYDVNDTIKASVEVTNSSARKGKAVVQLYAVSPSASDLAKPDKQLKGFKKVEIAAGATEVVEIDVKAADLWFWDGDKEKVDLGTWTFYLGADSALDPARGVSGTRTISGSLNDAIDVVSVIPDGVTLNTETPGNAIHANLSATKTDQSFIDLSAAGVTVTYTSSNPAAAVVDANGTVSPKAAGVALITAKVAAFGQEKVATFPVVVHQGTIAAQNNNPNGKGTNDYVTGNPSETLFSSLVSFPDQTIKVGADRQLSTGVIGAPVAGAVKYQLALGENDLKGVYFDRPDYAAGAALTADGKLTTTGPGVVRVTAYVADGTTAKRFYSHTATITVVPDTSAYDTAVGVSAALADRATTDVSSYTATSVKAWDDALAAYANGTGSAIDVGQAKAALVTAASKADLNTAISEASALVASGYTAASFAPLTAAIAAAQLVADNDVATQGEVDAAVAAIDDAIAGLVPFVSRTALNTAITQANTLNLANYTKATADALTDAVTAGIAVRDSAAPTQAQIDAATAAITAARAALKVKPLETLPYLDTSLPYNVRAADLVSRMTFQEKQQQLKAQTQTSSVTSATTGAAPAIPRLGVPAYGWWNEALHGVARSSGGNNLGLATDFPTGQGLAASWNRDLVLAAENAVSDEARAFTNNYNTGGIHSKGLTYWSPTINMARDPRWGRTEETYGEDPYLTGEIGAQFTLGLQGGNESVAASKSGKYLKAVATPKHFLANNAEIVRHTGTAVLTEAELREYYTPAFARLVGEGVGAKSLMTAYNHVTIKDVTDALPMSANFPILQDMVKRQWGFEGVITSDCDAIRDSWSPALGGALWVPEDVQALNNKFTGNGFPASDHMWDQPSGIAYTLKAGTDLACMDNDYTNNNAVSGLTSSAPAVGGATGLQVSAQYGYVSEANLDLSLVRAFTVRMQTGEFDNGARNNQNPAAGTTQSPLYGATPWGGLTLANTVDSPKHRALAATAAAEGTVLLKNEGLLPLAKPAADTKVVVVGHMAQLAVHGDYSPATSLDYNVSAQQGIKEYVAKALGKTTAEVVADGNFKFIPGFDMTGQWSSRKVALGRSVAGTAPDGTSIASAPAAVRFLNTEGRELGRVRPYDIYKTGLLAGWQGSKPFGTAYNATTPSFSSQGGEYGYFGIDVTIPEGTTQVVVEVPNTNTSYKGQYDVRIGDRWTGKKLGVVPVTGTTAVSVPVQELQPNYIADTLAGTKTKLFFELSSTFGTPTFTDAEKAAIADADVVVAYAGTTALQSMCLTNPSDPGAGCGGGSVSGSDSSEDEDRTNVDLPRHQADVIKQAAELNPNTVAWLATVSHVNVEPFKDDVAAVVWTTYNGQAQSRNIADVIYGDANPSGHLPFTWYSDIAQLPPIDDYQMTPDDTHSGRTYQYFTGDVTYPFGYGLSYSDFEISNLRLSSSTIDVNGTLKATVNVKNTSSVKGSEVVQLYVVGPKAGEDLRPDMQLKGFEKVELGASKSKDVTIELKASDLWFWDAEADKKTYDLGAWKVYVGESADLSKDLSANVTLSGKLNPGVDVVAALPDGVVLNTEVPGNVIHANLSATRTDQSFYDLNDPAVKVQYSATPAGIVSITADGTVSPLAAGNALVTAKVTADGTSKSTTFPVVVHTGTVAAPGATTANNPNPSITNDFPTTGNPSETLFSTLVDFADQTVSGNAAAAGVQLKASVVGVPGAGAVKYQLALAEENSAKATVTTAGVLKADQSGVVRVTAYVVDATSAKRVYGHTATITIAAPVDKAALSAAIGSASALITADYVANSYAPVTAAISAGQGVLADVDATQAQVDAATAAITSALDALVSLSALKTAIAGAQALDAARYTTASYAPLAAAITDGLDVVADPAATKAEVDAAIAAIAAARNGLKFVPAPPLANAPYLDTSLPFSVRAADLVSRMTFTEKQQQLRAQTQTNDAATGAAPAIPRLGVPAYDWWNEALHGIARSGAGTNSGLATDFPTGIGLASSWDRNLVLAAENAVSDEARAFTNYYNTGTSVHNKGLTYWSPTINMHRDPRWGRAEETYGEDPYLTGEIGSQFTLGLQGGNESTATSKSGQYLKAIATPKHFLANNAENYRHTGTAVLTEAELREYYTPAFAKLVGEGVGAKSLMTAYNHVTIVGETEALPMSANFPVLQDMVKRQWGFEGVITSDCDAIRDSWDPQQGGLLWIPEDVKALGNTFSGVSNADPALVDDSGASWDQASGISYTLKAGTDLDCMDNDYTSNVGIGGLVSTATVPSTNLTIDGSPVTIPAVGLQVSAANGYVSEADLDLSLVRAFTIRMQTGEFDNGGRDNAEPAAGTQSPLYGATDWADLSLENAVDTPEHRALAEKAAAAGTVLLKNENSALPLAKPTASTKVVVVGHMAQMAVHGDYSPQTSFEYNLSAARAVKEYVAGQLGVDVNSLADANFQYIPGFDMAGKWSYKKFNLGRTLTADPTHNVPAGAAAVRFLDASGNELGRITAQQIYRSGKIDGWKGSQPWGAYNAATSLSSQGTWDGYFGIDTLIPAGTASIAVENGGSGQLPGTIEVRVGQRYTGRVLGSIPIDLPAGSSYLTETSPNYLLDHLAGTKASLYFDFSSEYGFDGYTAAEEAAIADADVVIGYAGTTALQSLCATNPNDPGSGCSGGTSAASDSSEDEDRSNLDLPRNQDKAIKAAAQLAKPSAKVIAWLATVSQVNVESFKDDVDALVWTSYNGQAQSRNITDVLWGNVNPSGRLTFTWYSDIQQLPETPDYQMTPDDTHNGRTYQYFTGDVTYPFGYGLSYSSFEFSNLRLSDTDVDVNGTITATVNVKNTSAHKGQEVVQLYAVGPKAADALRPDKQLKGFEKIELGAGKSKDVTITLKAADLWFWDSAANKKAYDLGAWKLYVGPNSDLSQDLVANVTLSGSLTPAIDVVSAIPDGVTLNTEVAGNVIHANLSATRTDQSFYDLAKVKVEYSASPAGVVAITADGTVSPVAAGAALVTAKVTADGTTKSTTFPVVVHSGTVAAPHVPGSDAPNDTPAGVIDLCGWFGMPPGCGWEYAVPAAAGNPSETLFSTLVNFADQEVSATAAAAGVQLTGSVTGAPGAGDLKYRVALAEANTANATVTSDGRLTAAKPGVVRVTAYVTDASDARRTYTHTATIKVVGPTETTALADVVADAKAVVAADYTTDSVAALNAAIAAAQAVLADTDATQAQVDAALDAVAAAKAALAPAATKADLNAAITAGQAVDASAYTPASVAALDAAIADAKAVAANGNATQPQVDAAAAAIADAQAGLVARAGKAALENAIAVAETVSAADYTPASVAALNAAIAAAKAVTANGDATQAQIEAAVASVNEARAALVRPAAKAALDAAITAGEGVNAVDYTPASVAALNAAIAAAKAVAADANATQAQVEAAKEAISIAKGALVPVTPPQPVDKDGLSVTITVATQYLVNLDKALYTADSITALQAAIDNALNVLVKPTATASEVANAISSVSAAQAALVPVTPPQPTQPVDKSALPVSITVANQYLVSLDKALYTADSITALQAAIDNALNVLVKENATAAEVANAINGISAAKAGLVSVPTVTPPTPPVQVAAPSAVKISKVSVAKKKVTVKWAKAAAAQKVTGYQVSYKVKGASKWVTKTVKGAAKVSLTVKKLKKGKAYQVRVRVYKTVDGKSYYSKYSATKTSKKVK